MTGEGIKEFFEVVEASREEYDRCVFSPTFLVTRPVNSTIGNIFPSLYAPGLVAKNPYKMRRRIL